MESRCPVSMRPLLGCLTHSRIATYAWHATQFESEAFAIKWVDSEALDELFQEEVFTTEYEAYNIVRAIIYVMAERN